MSYIDHITEFLFDEQRRISSKAAVIICIIASIFFVDNYLGFSFHYSTDKKIEQVEKVNKIISDSSVDSTTKIFALNIRSEIIERKNMVDYLSSFFRGKSNNVIKHQDNKPTDNPKNAEPKSPSIKNNFWFNISASGIYLLFSLIMIPIVIFDSKEKSLIHRIEAGVASIMLFLFIGFIFIFVLRQIPQISSSSWLWNYVLNFTIQLATVGLLIYTGQRKK